MDEVTKKINGDVDYERYSFEDMGLNPYEIVIAASKYAREVNDKARKYMGPEVEIYPRNIAMNRLVTNKFQLIYPDDTQGKNEGSPVEGL